MVCAVSSCESIFFLLLLDLVSRETGSNARDRAGCKGAGMFSRTAGVAASAAASGAAAAASETVAAAAGVAAAATARAGAASAVAAAAGPAERVKDESGCCLLGLTSSCCLGAGPATTRSCCTGVAAAAVLLSRA